MNNFFLVDLSVEHIRSARGKPIPRLQSRIFDRKAVHEQRNSQKNSLPRKRHEILAPTHKPQIFARKIRRRTSRLQLRGLGRVHKKQPQRSQGTQRFRLHVRGTTQMATLIDSNRPTFL